MKSFSREMLWTSAWGCVIMSFLVGHGVALFITLAVFNAILAIFYPESPDPR